MKHKHHSKKKPQTFTMGDVKNNLSARWHHAEHETITNSSQRGDITSWARGTTPFIRPECDDRIPVQRRRAVTVDELRMATRVSAPKQFAALLPIDCPKFSSEGAKTTTAGEASDCRVDVSDRVNAIYQTLGKTAAVVRQY